MPVAFLTPRICQLATVGAKRPMAGEEASRLPICSHCPDIGDPESTILRPDCITSGTSCALQHFQECYIDAQESTYALP
jgi:hypothetical protein